MGPGHMLAGPCDKQGMRGRSFCSSPCQPPGTSGMGRARHQPKARGEVQLLLPASISLPHLLLSHPYLAHPGFPLAHGFPPLHCLPQPPLACRTQ